MSGARGKPDRREDRLVEALAGIAPPGRRSEVAPLIEAALEAERRRWLARAEELWLRRFGWSLVRPLLATAAGLALILLAWDRRQAAAVLAPLVAGAALFYVVLQVYVHVWTRRAQTREAAAAAHRDRATARLREAAR
ncbi:MAG: hypothetical protein Kow0062_12700 [Acidobacteriota bacterium]|nr:MAG: hypothetical protein D6738_02310 [Acidobacteriota bacterium]